MLILLQNLASWHQLSADAYLPNSQAAWISTPYRWLHSPKWHRSKVCFCIQPTNIYTFYIRNYRHGYKLHSYSEWGCVWQVQSTTLHIISHKIWKRFSRALSRIIMWMYSANERRRYIVTSSLIGLVHTQKNPCLFFSLVICRLFCQKHVSWVGISNHIPQFIMGCNYLCLS